MTNLILCLEYIKATLGLMMLIVLFWVITSRFTHGFRYYYITKAYSWLESGCNFFCNFLKPLVILDQVDYSPLILIFILWFIQRFIDLIIMFL